MYQMYRDIAQQMHDEVRDMYFRGELTTPEVIYEMRDRVNNYRTRYTLGDIGDCNICYALTKCLKSINERLAMYVEKELDKIYDRYAVTGDNNDFCQRFFHYDASHVANILKMIDNYHDSIAKSGQKSQIKPNLLAELPAIKEMLTADHHNPEEMKTYAEKIQNATYDMANFCDNIEKGLKDCFLNGLNNGIQQTVSQITSTDGRLKKLNGQDFDLLIHSSATPEEFLNNDYQHQLMSTSLVDDKNIRCYQPNNIKFAFYNAMSNDDFKVAFSHDASTTFSDDGMMSSFSIPKHVTLDAFKADTRQGTGISAYSEIMVDGQMRPNAIVCYDYVTEQELDLSQRHNLDLILIDTASYDDMLKPQARDERYVKKADLSALENTTKI